MGALGIVSPKEEVTVDLLKQKFPVKKNTITEETVALINQALEDPEFDKSTFLNQLADYQSCMLDANASMNEYINAMKFCAYLESCSTMTEAYKRARMNDEFVLKRFDAEPGSREYADLTSAASRYRKTKLVRQILTQSDMPLYLMFQGERYRAVAVLANEMQTAQYSKDRIAAADKLLSHVKPPDNLQIELGIGPNKEAKDLHMELNTQLALLAANQKALLSAGVPLQEVQRTGIQLNDVHDAEVDE